MSIFTAESFAVLCALRHGIERKKDFTIFTDSYSCLVAINNLTEHPIITRILIILSHTSLKISLCWVPSHCGVFGNVQADTLAKKALSSLYIEDIKLPKFDLIRQLKSRIYSTWQTEFNQAPLYKIKASVGHWITSYNKNRKYETVLARLRLNCVREIHLVPRIEGTFPLHCNCDGSRLSLYHIFFNCGYYINQRTDLIYMLQKDRKEFNLKSLLEDNQSYCDKVIKYLIDINYINKI